MKADVSTAIIIGAAIIVVAILLTQPAAEAAPQTVVNIQVTSPAYTFARDENGLWQMNGVTGEVKLLPV